MSDMNIWVENYDAIVKLTHKHTHTRNESNFTGRGQKMWVKLRVVLYSTIMNICTYTECIHSVYF